MCNKLNKLYTKKKLKFVQKIYFGKWRFFYIFFSVLLINKTFLFCGSYCHETDEFMRLFEFSKFVSK